MMGIGIVDSSGRSPGGCGAGWSAGSGACSPAVSAAGWPKGSAGGWSTAAGSSRAVAGSAGGRGRLLSGGRRGRLGGGRRGLAPGVPGCFGGPFRPRLSGLLGPRRWLFRLLCDRLFCPHRWPPGRQVRHLRRTVGRPAGRSGTSACTVGRPAGSRHLRLHRWPSGGQVRHLRVRFRLFHLRLGRLLLLGTALPGVPGQALPGVPGPALPPRRRGGLQVLRSPRARARLSRWDLSACAWAGSWGPPRPGVRGRR